MGQVNADPKDSALAQLPAGELRSELCLAGCHGHGRIRRKKLIQVPACIATCARRTSLHPPEAWPWQTGWEKLCTTTHAPPQAG